MGMTLSERIERTRLACEHALLDPGPLAVEHLLDSCGITAQTRLDILRNVAKLHEATPKLLSIRDLVLSSGGAAAQQGILQRTLLLRAALQSLDQIPHLPVEDSVKHLFCKEYVFYANPPEGALAKFECNTHPFLTMVKLALLTRFPAGQQQWEISGLPRSWLPRLRLGHALKALSYFATKARAFHPYFVPHLAVSSTTVAFMAEREFMKSFYRMAASLENQPAIRGIMAFSWLHSRETHRVSPHLAFLNRPFLESGGFYADLGPAPENAGFLARDVNRAALYRSGQYRPTLALITCTREQALAWRCSHLYLEEKCSVE
jgi:hypothetical protein